MSGDRAPAPPPGPGVAGLRGDAPPGDAGTRAEGEGREARRQPDGAAGDGRPRSSRPFVRSQVIGLVLLGTGPALSALAEVAVFGRDGLAGFLFAAPLVASALVTALLVPSGRAWARLLGIVIATLHVLAFAEVLLEVTAYLASPLDLVPVAAVMLGALLAVAAGIGAFVVSDGSRATGAVERWAVRSVLVAVLLVAIGSLVLTVLSDQSVDEAAARFAVRVDMVDFVFAPLDVEVPVDGRVLVHNSDPVMHTFTVPGLGIDRTIAPGGDALIDLRGVEPGEWAVYCKPHADEAEPDPDRAGMAARLAVG